MSTSIKLVSLVSLVAVSFLAGSRFKANKSIHSPAGARRALYYHDPMHPAYKSDKPGTAPDCGMELEPVYAAGEPSGADNPARLAPPPAAVRVSAEKQQMIGVRVEEVQKSAGVQSIRALGRVAIDETRVYKINATLEGWIREINGAVSTGSIVQKDQTLASYYAPEFLSAQQAYFFALGALDRFQGSAKETADQIKLTRANIQRAKDALQVMGMSELQANEIAKTRELTQQIRIVAPANGFVIARNVSPGQRFEKGTEFFRIADVSQVWIVADVFENETLIQQSAGARVSYQGTSFTARMTGVPPQFDPASRTLKVRLEAENPRYTLRPDMFVDVEFQVNLPAAITAPADAVIDSGLRKTVFVDLGDGYFEPRTVETGWRTGERVQITKGLEAGDRIVVAGNFLLDSESRMKLTSIRAAAATGGKDPACGMEVDPAKAAAKSEHKGKTYYFCSKGCKEKFDRDPEQYLPKQQLAQHAGAAHD